MDDTMFPREPYLRIDVPSVDAAGQAIAAVSTTLDHTLTEARTAAYRALGAIPASDLFESLAFCWGRWSTVLDSATAALAHTGAAVRDSAETLGAADRSAPALFPLTA